MIEAFSIIMQEKKPFTKENNAFKRVTQHQIDGNRTRSPFSKSKYFGASRKRPDAPAKTFYDALITP